MSALIRVVVVLQAVITLGVAWAAALNSGHSPNVLDVLAGAALVFNVACLYRAFAVLQGRKAK